MRDQSNILIFIDDEPIPIANFKSPVSFELDTRRLVDGEHMLKIVSKGPDGKEGIRKIPFQVKNGPAILIEGIKENAVVDGVLPVMINAYSKGDQTKFLITGSETPQSIPFWLWILVIGTFVWIAYYFIAYFNTL
jgi:hypothetical protein